ncbi:MAG: hypothetical protein O9353_05370 [Bacteroidia bacterium]|nr:hypothetical protein [Bacteroidia bacterium]
MNTNIFYSYNVKQRMKLVEMKGEYISRIKYYGFYINLYVLEGHFVEAYFNRYTNTLDQVEMMDPADDRLNLYAVCVNLSHLFEG